MRCRQLQPLLFRHTAALMGAAGAAAALHPGLGLSACVLLATTDGRARRAPALLLLLCCAVAGWGWSVFRTPPYPAEKDAAAIGAGRAEISGRIVAVRGLPDQRLRIVLDEVRAVWTEGKAVSFSGRTAWTWDQPDRRPLPGERVTFRAGLRPATGFRNEGGPDFSLYQRRQGVTLTAWSRGSGDGLPRFSGAPPSGELRRERLQSRLIEVLNRLYPPSAAAPNATTLVPHGCGALPALLFGDRSYLSSADMERLNHAGLSHSLALSGQHLAVAGLAGALLVALLGRLRPRIFLRLPRHKMLPLASLPLAALYLWLGGAPPSLVRAGLMLGIWAVLCCRNTAAVGPDVLIGALVCMILIDPLCLGDVGLHLSFSAVAGIMLIVPLLRRTFDTLPEPRQSLFRRIGFALRSCLFCSLAVQIAALPLMLHTFGRISPWFLLNLIWLPVLGLWVLPAAFAGLCCLAVGLEGGAELLLRAAAEPCDLLLRLLRHMESTGMLDSLWGLRPHWSSLPGHAALLVAAALCAGRREPPPAARRLVFAGIALLLVGPALRTADGLSNEIRLRVLDVGQSQAVLIEWPGQGRALVDGGGFASTRFDGGRDVVFPVLTANRPPRLDLVALSHPDMDHLRGLIFITRQADIGRVILPAGLPDDAAATNRDLTMWYRELHCRGLEAEALHAGAVVPLGPNLSLEAADPPEGRLLRRNEGLVLRLTLGKRGLALLPGDLEGSALRRLVRSGRNLRADVLVVPHHGAAGAAVPALYKAVQPRQALVSCGRGNRWGFPSQRVRELAARCGILLRSTAEEGELRVVWDAGDGRRPDTEPAGRSP